MRIPHLLSVIDRLPAAQPLTDAYEDELCIGSAKLEGSWYDSQKQHLQGWLAEYGGPGAYGRRRGSDDARCFYNRFQCAPGLIWLAEALGEDDAVVARGIQAVRDAGPRSAAQCGAFRAVVPWSRIDELAEVQHARLVVRRPSIPKRVAGRPRY